ncbi:MAG: DNA polymerase III subunit gamma/tau, partial [Cyanobacteria bacterium J06635_10]
PNIEKAFQVTYKREIQVFLEKTSSVTSVKSNSVAVSTPVQQKPSVASIQTPPQRLPQPAPLPTPEDKVLTPKTQPSTPTKNTAPPKQTTPTPSPINPTAEEDEADKIMYAAKRLAEALDGEIIPLSEEKTEISDEPVDSSELEEIDEDDVDF